MAILYLCSRILFVRWLYKSSDTKIMFCKHEYAKEKQCSVKVLKCVCE